MISPMPRIESSLAKLGFTLDSDRAKKGARNGEKVFANSCDHLYYFCFDWRSGMRKAESSIAGLARPRSAGRGRSRELDLQGCKTGSTQRTNSGKDRRAGFHSG